MLSTAIPTEISDPVNARILSVEHVRPSKAGERVTRYNALFHWCVVYQHKAAIDEHLASLGIQVLYTNVFWGGRSEIKPSEVSPVEYERWCVRTGMDPGTMRAGSD